MKILLTGYKGKLGQELSKYLDIIPFEGDFTMPIIKQECDLVIHAGAYTKVQEAETEINACFNANVYGTFNLVNVYQDIPFVYISTEYARNPLGVYALTKYLGEEVVKQHPQHLIIRTLFKPCPWPFDEAYEDQFTRGDYVDVIAQLIAEEVEKWDRQSKFMYIGTNRKTMLELAQRTKPDVIPNKITSSIIPHDY